MKRRGERGFTLISMMLVISIMLILLGVAMPIYSRSMLRAREDNLRRNLETMNQAIFQYTQDKSKAPQSLDDVRSAGYLKEIPKGMSIYQKDADGIIGVHSSSTQIGSNGTAYNTW